MSRPSCRLFAAALGLAALAPASASAQDSRGNTVVIEPSIGAASAAPGELLATRIEMRQYVTTADNTVPAGVNPNLTPPPSSGSPTGFNDPRLGFNNARYWAKGEQYSGVTQLIMTYDVRDLATGATGTAGFLCTGALINGGRSVLTAGHCLNNSVENGVQYTLRNVQVRLGQNFGGNFTAEPGAGAPSVNQSFSYVQTVNAGNVKIHPDYTGSVIDERDIAVINLDTAAPATFRSYDLHTGAVFGEQRNVVGYGGRGNGELGVVNAGGSTGSQQRIRQGLNTFDITYDSPLWSDSFKTLLFGARGGQDVYLEDFDNGLEANNALCRLSYGTLGGLPIWLGTDAQRPCGLGLGINEVTIAGGDSGGPSFLNGRIAAVTSFGQSFGTGFFGDFRAGLNSSFGEIGGMTRVDINLSFIQASVVPEPSTMAVLGLGLIGLAGLAARRRNV